MKPPSKSSEKKLIQREKALAMWAARTPEERSAIGKKVQATRKANEAAMDPEELALRRKRQGEAIALGHANRVLPTPEEVAKRRHKLAVSRLEKAGKKVYSKHAGGYPPNAAEILRGKLAVIRNPNSCYGPYNAVIPTIRKMGIPVVSVLGPNPNSTLGPRTQTFVAIEGELWNWEGRKTAEAIIAYIEEHSQKTESSSWGRTL